MPIRQCVGGLEATFRSVFWSSRRRRGATDRAVRPRGTVPATLAALSTRHAPVLISGLGKVGKSFGRVFQRKEGGEEPGATPGSSTTSRLRGGAAPTPACPTEGHSPSHTRDGTGAPRKLDLFPLPEGKGGTATDLRELRGARPARAARDGAPPSGCGAPRSARHAPVLYIRAGKSWKIVRESFSKKGGGRGARGDPWLLDHLQAPRGGSADAGLPHRGHLSFPYTRWHWCPSIPGSFSPLRGRGEDSQALRELRGRSPARTGPRRCTSVGRRSSAFLPGTTWDLGLPPGHQGRCAAPCARLGAPSWAARRLAPASIPPGWRECPL